MNELQSKVRRFIIQCMGLPEVSNLDNRNARFVEEALGFAQACGMPRGDAMRLVHYVYDKPPGDPSSEAGDVMFSMAGVCNIMAINMQFEAMRALARNGVNMDKIRAKFLARPTDSPLPVAVDDHAQALHDIAPWLTVLLEGISNPAPEFIEVCNRIFELAGSSDLQTV